MRCSIEPSDRIYVTGYEFYLLLKTWVKILAVNTIKSAKKTTNGCNKKCFKKGNSKTSRSN